MDIRVLIKQNIPIVIACISFLVFIISVNQIINLARPTKSTPKNYHVQNQLYNSALMMASTPTQNYKTITTELSAKYPNVPNAAAMVGINPEIAKLPPEAQTAAIKQSITESRIEFLNTQLISISETENESLLFNVCFYIWSFLAWGASIVFGSMLTHATDRFNQQYLSRWLDRWIPKITDK